MYSINAIREKPQSFPVSGKVSRDILWNMGSIVILGISGMLLNIIIARYYGAAVLGVFNEVLAIYVILSQLSVGGLYFSVLRFVSEFAEDIDKSSKIISSAVVISGFVAGVFCLLAFLSRDIIGKIFESDNVSMGLAYIVPALWCFTLNKILMASINGARHMKVYAFAQTSRYVLIIVFIAIATSQSLDGAKLPAVFSVTESILLLFLLSYVFRIYHFVFPGQWAGWGRRHISFSRRGFITGLMADINGRVDILILGYFCSDRTVGIYSFAAMIAEGFFQLTVVVRENISPVLTRLATTMQYSEIRALAKKTIRIFCPAMAITGLVVFLLYPLLVKVLVGTKEFLTGWYALGILFLGIVVSSGYQPFILLLNQAGYPGANALLFLLIVITNVILNAVLVPVAGLYGAAIATCLAYFCTIVYVKVFVKRVMQLAI